MPCIYITLLNLVPTLFSQHQSVTVRNFDVQRMRKTVTSDIFIKRMRQTILKDIFAQRMRETVLEDIF